MTKPTFIQELQRRRMVRVALLYVGASFLALQGAQLLFPALLVPDWAYRMLVVVTILGLPVVLAVVWAAAGPAAPVVDVVSAPPAPAALAAQARSASAVRSVAVLPFVNMSADRENEYFSDGITEELLNVLTRLGRFRVPARTSCFAFKGRDTDVREIGRQLDVDAVIEGSVRRSGDRVRITSQLVSVADGYHLWSESYDREMQDIFAIQDEIALRVVDALQVRLTDREVDNIRKAPTHNIRAYEYYLKGRQSTYESNRLSFNQAREFFRRAIELDPTYALAYAGFADCCSFLYMYWEKNDQNLAEADRASRTALEHDGELAEAHASRGLVLTLRGQFPEAERELQRAIQLDPTLFEAYYYYARAMFAQGQADRAAELFREANRRRPEDYQSLALLCTVYYGQGRVSEERETAREVLQIIRQHLKLYPHDDRALVMGAGALVILGDQQEGRAWLEQASRSDDSGVLYNAACGFVRLQDYECAMQTLERAITIGFAHRDWLQHDPDLEPLRDNPRFAELVSRL